jgi:hypothetical protein
LNRLMAKKGVVQRGIRFSYKPEPLLPTAYPELEHSILLLTCAISWRPNRKKKHLKCLLLCAQATEGGSSLFAKLGITLT